MCTHELLIGLFVAASGPLHERALVMWSAHHVLWLYTAIAIRVPGMFARVARYEVTPDRTPEAIEAFHDAVTQLEGTPGLAGGYVFVDYEDGAIMSMTLWENRTALDESERKASGLRQDAAKRVDGRVVSVQSLDVAIEIGAAVRG